MTGEPRLRVALDATPLLGARTGIGTYVAELVAALGARPDLDVRLAAFSVRRRAALRAVPAGTRLVHRPVPARLLHRAWARGDLPPAAAVMGRADVVHGTNFVLPPPARAAGVVTVHDLTFVHHPEWVTAASLDNVRLMPRALARADVVVVPTDAVRRELQAEYGIAPARVRTVPLGVAPAWHESASLPRPPGTPAAYVLAVGTLEPRKGLDVLLRAYRELLAADGDAPPLVLVGPAGWGPELDVVGLPRDRVVVTGYRDARTVRALVAHASVLAFPSRYEGFGLPPLEALAAGTPVVASDIAAVREVIGPHARYAAVGDAPSLAAALRQTLASPPGTAEREAARRHAAGFTWERCAATTAAIYHEIGSR